LKEAVSVKKLIYGMGLLVTVFVAGTAQPVFANKGVYGGKLGTYAGQVLCDCTVCSSECFCVYP
jgi:hypothetical protein